MMTEKIVKERLEFLKQHMYEELNQLKDRLSQESRLDMNDFNPGRYKPTKHQKSCKRSCTYRKNYKGA